MLEKKTKYNIFVAAGWIIFLAAIALFLFTGNTLDILKEIFTGDLSQEELSAKLQELGWQGNVAITVISALQVVCSFFPAEPIQVISGFTFGFWMGTLWCWLGEFIGDSIIFMLRKTFGNHLDYFFNKKLRLDLNKLAQSNKYILIIFILYFLPAIPCGMICFFAASMGIPYRRYIWVTMLGSLPSILVGVGLGQVASASNWMLSICVFAFLIILLVIMMFKKDILFEKLNNYADKHKKTKLPNSKNKPEN